MELVFQTSSSVMELMIVLMVSFFLLIKKGTSAKSISYLLPRQFYVVSSIIIMLFFGVTACMENHCSLVSTGKLIHC